MTSASLNHQAQATERVAQALALAIAHARQGQTAQALAPLAGTINRAEQRQALCRVLIDRPNPSLGRAIALHRGPQGKPTRDPHQQALGRFLRRSLAVETSPNQSLAARAADLNRHGEGLFKAGRYKRAAECFQRAFALAPNNVWYCLNLAEAVARVPVKKGEVWETEALGRAIAETGKWDVAVRHYRQALKLDAGGAIVERCDFLRLQTYMGEDHLIPEMHGWPISPDLGVLLIRLLEAKPYDAVIEFGSGVSTLILAQAVRKSAARYNRPLAPVLSIEHLEQYREQTDAHLRKAGLRALVDLCLAPLEPYQADNGETYPYYSIPAFRLKLSLSFPE